MKKLNAKGSSPLHIVLIVVIIGLIAGVGYYVYNSQKKTNTALDNTANSQAEPVKSEEKEDRKNVELITSNIPEGWATDLQEADRVYLRNESNKCFVSIISTLDTAESNSSSVDQNKQTIDAIKEKGYNVNVLTKANLDLTTNSGIKSLESLEIEITGNNNPLSQSYGFITTEQRYTTVQVSCTNRNDLPNARQALTAIKVNL
jgi:hypothetical protein